MQENLLTEYASYKLKTKFEPYIGRKRFFKLMYLLNNELKGTPSDIKLPYYWYCYGPVVYKEAQYFNMNFKSSFSGIQDNLKSLIDKGINYLYDNFQYVTTEDINSIVYQDAPFEFEREFRELIMLINSWEDNGTTYSGFNPKNFDPVSCLDRLIIKFPEKEFDDLFSLFLEWENISRYIFVNYPTHKDEIKILIKTFSKIFSKKLRIFANENIESKQIQNWFIDYKRSFSEFNEFISEKNYEFYEEYYKPSGKHQEIVNELHELSAKMIRE